MPQPKYSTKYANSWAVIVGINEYSRVTPLEYACNDARALAALLISKFGFPDANVTVLLDKDATLQRVQQAMHRLVRTTGEDDRVIVFYAGHGHTVPAQGREAGFLVPVDGDSDDTATLLPWDGLVHTARMIPAKHLIFMMDACYGGLIGMRALAPGTTRLLGDMLSRYSRQFISAGKANELVADGGGPRSGHSLFTGHLLDALEGGLRVTDGVLSANALMTHVYDRVSRDPHSRQAPHYGFLAGDGDLFFSTPLVEDDPAKPRPNAEILVEIPADLLTPQVTGGTTAPASVIELAKEYLSEHRYRIQLNELVMRELRAGQQRLGEANFSVKGTTVLEKEFAERLVQYESAMGDILPLAVLCGRWATAEHQLTVREFVNVLAGGIETRDGLVIWLALRSYPMLLTMYAAGIAALQADNYQVLKTLLATPTKTDSDRGPKPVVQVVVRAMLDLARMDAFKRVPGYERNYSPQSEYLFKRVQPIVEDALFLGPRYEALFDRFEVFYALAHADYDDGYWGHPGRFAWKYCNHGASNPFTSIVEEAKREGDNWPPLRAGLFRGSHARFAEVAEMFKTELLSKLNWF